MMHEMYYVTKKIVKNPLSKMKNVDVKKVLETNMILCTQL